MLTGPDERGISRLQLDRPNQANALNEDTVERLLRAFEDARANGTRLMVLSATGRNFCAGFDLADLEKQSDGDLLRRFVRLEQLLETIFEAPFYTVACVDGWAIGAGADIVVACAHRLGTGRAKFRFPGPGFGVALGTRRLSSVVGRDAARCVLASGEPVDSAQAHELGLLTAIVESDDFSSDVVGIAESIVGLDRQTLSTLLTRTEKGADGDGDLATLVRSTAEPGLRSRMERFVRGEHGSY
jgi:enoyl-CoA hydratase/carnithine racemase